MAWDEPKGGFEGGLRPLRGSAALPPTGRAPAREINSDAGGTAGGSAGIGQDRQFLQRTADIAADYLAYLQAECAVWDGRIVTPNNYGWGYTINFVALWRRLVRR